MKSHMQLTKEMRDPQEETTLEDGTADSDILILK